jgi:hypothetical protein
MVSSKSKVLQLHDSAHTHLEFSDRLHLLSSQQIQTLYTPLLVGTAFRELGMGTKARVLQI